MPIEENAMLGAIIADMGYDTRVHAPASLQDG